MPKPFKILTALALTVLWACSAEMSPEVQANIEKNTPAPPSKITKEGAIDLLNQGKVTEIGVTHSGWTILTLTDGTHVSNEATDIGYPEELMAACKNCSEIIQWME